MELAEDVRHTPKGKEIYKLRSETIERVFADAKEKHAMRYTQFRGLARLKMQVLLTFSCMNIKKLLKLKKKNGMISSLLNSFCTQVLNFFNFPKYLYENAIAV